MNTDELEQAIYMAERRVLEIQAKLHRWAGEDPHRRFDDLFNLVCRSRLPAGRLGSGAGQQGREAPPGWTATTAHSIEAVRGVEEFLGAAAGPR